MFAAPGDPLFGDLTITISAEGQVAVVGELVPVPGIARMEATGTLSLEQTQICDTGRHASGGSAVFEMTLSEEPSSGQALCDLSTGGVLTPVPYSGARAFPIMEPGGGSSVRAKAHTFPGPRPAHGAFTLTRSRSDTALRQAAVCPAPGSFPSNSPASPMVHG